MTAPLEHLARNQRLDRFFIGGAWREPKGIASGVVVNPATEEVVVRFALGNGEDVDAAVSAAPGLRRLEPDQAATPRRSARSPAGVARDAQ